MSGCRHGFSEHMEVIAAARTLPARGALDFGAHGEDIDTFAAPHEGRDRSVNALVAVACKLIGLELARDGPRRLAVGQSRAEAGLFVTFS